MYRPQSSFSAGELDPALRERTDFEKYRAGLGVGRNILIGKTGRVISRSGTVKQFNTKYPTQVSVIYSPPYSQFIVELTKNNLRLRDTTVGTFQDNPLSGLTDANIQSAQFVAAGIGFLYIFMQGLPIAKLSYGNVQPFALLFGSNIFYQPQPPLLNSANLPSTTATGQPVDYAISYISNGQESYYLEIPGTDPLSVYPQLREPQAANEHNVLNVLFVGTLANISSIVFYRRPSGGGAYGFCGELILPNPPATAITITDYNTATVPNYSHSPPASIPIVYPEVKNGNPILNVTARTGAIYQQRLLTSDDNSTEAIYGSRTGFQNSFFAESTLTSDSAVMFKSGSTGSANVLRLWDSQYGLLVFTTVGVFQNTGALDYQNLSLNKVSSVVIQDNLPPLQVPGGLLVVDKATNSVQSLIYSYVEQTFPPDEVSIFSYHLLENKKVISWAFQDGAIPLIWLVLDDGSLLSLTYQREQQMRAWTHHDSNGAKFECVTVLKNLENQAIVYFQVNRNGVRVVESLSPRVLGDIKDFVAMDASVTYKNDIGAGAGGAKFTITAQDNTNWKGLLNISSNFGAFSNTTGQGKAGDIFRFFDRDGCNVDLQVVTYIDSAHLVLQPMNGLEFPEDQGVGAVIYGTYSTLTGLDHLEGQAVSVLSDGYVLGSPNNDIEKYNTYVVTNGSITLNNGKLGAIIHVGIPFTSDIETLDIDTVEQKPTLLESKIVNKVYMKILKSEGLYVSCVGFPDNDSVFEMTDPETIENNAVLDIIGNRAQPPTTERYQIICRNEYKSNCKVSIRQVDPLPFEILSIIPDLQVLI